MDLLILSDKGSTNNLLGLVGNLTSNEINKFEKEISGKGAVEAGKEFTLFWMEIWIILLKL